MRASVAAQIGRDPFVPGAPLRLVVTILRQGTAFVALIEARDAAGARTWVHPPLPDDDCRNLVRTVSLSIAVEIDPFPQPPGAPEPVPVLDGTPPAPPALPPPPPIVGDVRPPPPIAAPSNRPKVRLGLGVAAELGIASSLAAGLTAQVGVRWRLASISVEGRADLPVVSDTGKPGPQVRSMFMAGSLVPCGHVPLPLPQWNVALCGLLTLGAVRAERLDQPVGGRVLNAAPGGSSVYVGAGARASLGIPVGGPVALLVSGEILGSVRPALISIHDVGRPMNSLSLTTAPVTAGLGGGVAVEF